METLLIALLAGLGFIVAYHTYGRWLGKKIFRLSASAVCPSEKLEDGVDYVPTKKSIVFGHHFTSIAGTGPIVGPAIAVIWGWLPALLWVVLGSIFIGAVHDFGALVVSLRNNGQTVGDIAGRVINRRVRVLFLCILVMALTIVLAIFGWVIAKVFQTFPAAIFPCLIQIPIAVGIGLWLHRRQVNLLLPSLLALGVMYLTVIYGNTGFLGGINTWLAELPFMVWVAILLAYSYVASVLPVWTLLQPRDYINSLQLITSLALIVLGLGVAAVIGGAPVDGVRPELAIAAPMYETNWQAKGALVIFPFLFITIACGAVSGFHCLVSSGTSSKQLRNEEDARFVGYGSMLTEGFLATLVILACVAGLGLGFEGKLGVEAWDARYATWGDVTKGAVGSFVFGAANFLKALGLSAVVATAIMAVLVASFAGTTLDTACRLQRYVIQELAATLRAPKAEGGSGWGFLKCFENKHVATLTAVSAALFLAAVPNNGEWTWANIGTGGLILWPLFGATNQLLAGLAFLVITFYLWRRGISMWFLVFPLVLMLVMPMWAMPYQLWEAPGWLLTAREGFPDHKPNYLLGGIGLATIALEIWMIVEAVKIFPKAKGVLEENALDQKPEPASAKA